MIDSRFKNFFDSIRLGEARKSINGESNIILYSTDGLLTDEGNGRFSIIHLYHSLCYLVDTPIKMIEAPTRPTEVDNIEKMARLWVKMNKKAYVEPDDTARDTLPIKTLYLKLHERTGEAAQRYGKYAFDLIVRLYKEDSIPLLVRFEEDGSIREVGNGLNQALSFNYEVRGTAYRNRSLSNLLLNWTAYAQDEGTNDILLNRDALALGSLVNDPLRTLAYVLNKDELFSYLPIYGSSLTFNKPVVPSEVKELLPTNANPFFLISEMLDILDDHIAMRLEAPEVVIKTKGGTQVTKIKSTDTWHAQHVLKTESVDTTQSGAATKEQPCASCIDSILKNADLGISDAQRYAIVGLLAMAFDMQIPD